MKDKASKLYDVFFSRILNKKPYVSLKIACSLDGKIALKNNKSKWITNELSRSYSHLLRSQNDAIMTSSSTILNDNPRMNCRLNGLEINSPIKVILDRFLKVSSKSIFGLCEPLLISEFAAKCQISPILYFDIIFLNTCSSFLELHIFNFMNL